jgi:pyruvate kinase
MDADMSEVIEEDTHDMAHLGRGCKVVVTIGPASHSVETLVQLLAHGMSCARLDLTWGTMQFHSDTLRNLAEAMKVTKKLCAVWVDTSGREIVVTRPTHVSDDGWLCLDQTPVTFSKGSEVVISTKGGVDDCSSHVLPITKKELPALVHMGQHLQVGRYMSTGAEGGSLMLKVTGLTKDEIKCVALNDASLAGALMILVSHRDTSLEHHSEDLNKSLPLFTEGDKTMIMEMGKKYEIDYVSLSYCNSAQDVIEARDLLNNFGLTQTKIVAKIERKAAIHNFEDIIAIADGILFSRGNLGLDFEPEEMAHLQKKCILRCNAIARPIILTRFVDTMVNTPRPTRAEATDVANAVLDGCDGVMLGAETLRGLYPVETVETVAKLCRSAEKYFDYRAHHEQLMGEAFDDESTLRRSEMGSLSNLDLSSASNHHMHSFASYARNETLKISKRGSGDFDSINENRIDDDDILSPSMLEVRSCILVVVSPSYLSRFSAAGFMDVHARACAGGCFASHLGLSLHSLVPARRAPRICPRRLPSG